MAADAVYYIIFIIGPQIYYISHLLIQKLKAVYTIFCRCVPPPPKQPNDRLDRQRLPPKYPMSFQC